MSRNTMLCTPKWGVAIAICTTILIGCRKPDADLGLDLLPGDELGLSIQTAPVRAYTFPDSARRTSGLSRNLVGSYMDPEFGSLRAAFVAQLRLTANNIGSGQETVGLVPDSIVLALAFDLPTFGYGNLHPQLFTVHEISEDLSVDSTYYTDDFPELVDGDLVEEHAGLLTPQPLATPEIGGVVSVPQLRIRLKESLARRILGAFNTPDLVDNTAFLNFFKGIQVSVENGSQAPLQGGVLYFSTLNSASKLTIYYKDTLSSDPELPRIMDLVISSNSVRYNVVERDRSQAVTLVQALSDTSAPAPLVYLQTLGGLRTAVRFPDLIDRTGEGKALSKAELVVPVAGTYYPYYDPPPLVFIFRKGITGADTLLLDQQSGIQGIGGAFNSVTNEYHFNITRHVQQIFNGSLANNGVELIAGKAGESADRVVLCGPEHPDTPMHLQLTFTTY